MSKTIGIISDTHGVIKEKAIEALEDCDLIIHAGDIGTIDVLNALREIAPVYAVKGNIDKGEWTEKLPKTETVKVDDLSIYVIHNIKEMNIDPKESNFNVIVYGHSHKHSMQVKDDILYINPGGSGRRRFKLPLTVALLHISAGEKKVDFVYIE